MITEQQKIAVVTGASSGIGYGIAQGLVLSGFHVIITGRNESAGVEAISRLRHEAQTGTVDFVQADSSKKIDMEQLALHIQERLGRLDVLVNNAGYVTGVRQVSNDGLEMNLAVNHLMPLYLTYLLFPLLQQSSDARVVNLLTQNHRFVKRKWLDDMNSEQYFQGMDAYGKTKLYNLLCLYRISVEQEHVKMFAADPGGNDTALMKTAMASVPPQMKIGMAIVRPFFSRVLAKKTLADGAKSGIQAAISQEYRTKAGLYLNEKAMIEQSSKRSYDKFLQDKVWRASQEMLGIDFSQVLHK